MDCLAKHPQPSLAALGGAHRSPTRSVCPAVIVEPAARSAFTRTHFSTSIATGYDHRHENSL